MANFVEALGRSQALTSAISGIQGIQQGELAIQNSKMQQAINEHTFKKMKAEEEEANRLIPMDQILSQLTPKVKDFWVKSLQPYIQNGASGGIYSSKKYSAQIKEMVHDEMFSMQNDKLFLEDLTTQKQEIENKIKQMSQPDAEGKAPKIDEKEKEALTLQLANIDKKIIAVDQSLDAFGRRKKEREDYTLNPGDTRFSGATNAQVATGGVKPPILPYKIGERHKFTGKDGKQYEGTFKGLNPDTKEPVFENISQVAEKPEKPAYTPETAMRRRSMIRAAIAKMNSGSSFDAALAVQFPNLAPLMGAKNDPESKQVAIDTLNEELDNLEQYIPAKYKSKEKSIETGVMDTMPPADKHRGEAIKDTKTGKYLRSDGKSWKEVK